jgi:hypothetical protein
LLGLNVRIWRPSRLDPFVDFPGFEFPTTAYTITGHASIQDPIVVGLIADVQMFADVID